MKKKYKIYLHNAKVMNIVPMSFDKWINHPVTRYARKIK